MANSQSWCQQQQQCQHASPTIIGASIDYASSDAINYATNYGEHATGARLAASATTHAT
jgi:hypothetical protein